MKDNSAEWIIKIVNVLDFDMLVTVLKESMDKYEKNPTKENKYTLIFDATMLGLKEVLNKEGVDSLLKQMNSFSGFLNPLLKNQN